MIQATIVILMGWLSANCQRILDAFECIPKPVPQLKIPERWGPREVPPPTGKKPTDPTRTP